MTINESNAKAKGLEEIVPNTWGFIFKKSERVAVKNHPTEQNEYLYKFLAPVK